ncbi:MAG TPA: hypothetical protein VEY71_06925 [Chitinophagales bacterium]|nr:hypothetical protein [Chitinophagales bacterium]
MNPVPRTAAVLMDRLFTKTSSGDDWVKWAIEMLQAGYETESLLILAAESPPYNGFELDDLTTKVLHDLKLDYSDKHLVVKNYVSYLISEALQGRIEVLKALRKLRDLCIELDYESSLMDFYLLYYAKEDLLVDNVQWYWNDADRSNIDEIIINRFKRWIEGNQVDMKL